MAVSISQKYSDLKAATLEQWRGWAAAVADGKATPTPVAVLEAGAILDIPEPINALRGDADAINAARGLELRIEQLEARDQARVAPFGGYIGAKQRLLELEGEVKAIRGILHGFGFERGHTNGELSRLKAKHPRVFAEAEATK